LAQQDCKFQSTQFITQPDQIQHINSITDFILDNSTYIFVTCIITEVQVTNKFKSTTQKFQPTQKFQAAQKFQHTQKIQPTQKF
jgi:hypothetical protein